MNKNRILNVLVIIILVLAIFLVVANILGINILHAFSESSNQSTGAAFCK